MRIPPQAKNTNNNITCYAQCSFIGDKEIKCEVYWPSGVNKTISFGHMTITLKVDEPSSIEMVTLRKFYIKSKLFLYQHVKHEIKFEHVSLDTLTGEGASVRHYQYTGWPDFGAPDNPVPILQLCKEMSKLAPNRPLIHCSAGVGRTGTFLAMLKIIDQV